MAVWGRHLNKCDVEGKRLPIFEQQRNFREKDRRVVGVASRDCGPHVAADKQRVVPNVATEFRRRVGCRGFGVKMNDLDIGQLVSPSAKRFDQTDRRHRCLVEKHPVPRVHNIDRLFGVYDLHRFTSSPRPDRASNRTDANRDHRPWVLRCTRSGEIATSLSSAAAFATAAPLDRSV